MLNTLQVVSFNCQGVKNVSNYRLCKNTHNIALHETQIFPYEQIINPNFASFSLSTVDLDAGIVDSRPHGGVLLLQENIAHQCKIVWVILMLMLMVFFTLNCRVCSNLESIISVCNAFQLVLTRTLITAHYLGPGQTTTPPLRLQVMLFTTFLSVMSIMGLGTSP